MATADRLASRAAPQVWQGGSRVAAVRWRGRLPATVWLHHGVGSTVAWDAFLPEAAQGREAVAYDRRGFGAAPRRGEPGIDLFDEGVADLVELIGRMGGEPVHLIGHSDGGTVALLCAARRPELVRSLTVVATHVCGDPGTIARLVEMGVPATWPEPMVRSLRRAHGDDWEAVATGWHRLWTSPAWATWTITAELGSIRCAVLAVHDRRDRLAPPLHAHAIVARVPGARVEWRDTGTHDPHRADPARFVRELAALWEGVE